MDAFYNRLNELFKYDPGNRGILDSLPNPDLERLTAELNDIKLAFVITGFPIYGENLGETDGPPGAANIAKALLEAGKEVVMVTDELNLPLVKAAVHAYSLNCPVVCVPAVDGGFCQKLLDEYKPSHIIAIERPSKIDGHFRNMRGIIIDELIGDTDWLFSGFSGIKIGVGDGGNEMGMGSFKPYAEGFTCSDTYCDYPLAAGISNWWGWGLGALISLNLGRNILPSSQEEIELLRAIVEAGAIDGISKQNVMTVDGISLEGNLEVLGKIHILLEEALGNKKG